MGLLNMKEYRCEKDNNLLFKGHLPKGTKIIVMCKNKGNKNEQGKYVKCKTVKEIEVK